MSQSSSHDHHDHGGHNRGHAGHHHGHHHHHGDSQHAGPFPWRRLGWATLLVAFAVAAASLVQVRSGEATVITRFGNPARVLLQPGLGWRWPVPFEAAVPVDCVYVPAPAVCRMSVLVMGCGLSSRPM